jgi:hypothetical protein
MLFDIGPAGVGSASQRNRTMQVEQLPSGVEFGPKCAAELILKVAGTSRADTRRLIAYSAMTKRGTALGRLIDPDGRGILIEGVSGPSAISLQAFSLEGGVVATEIGTGQLTAGEVAICNLEIDGRDVICIVQAVSVPQLSTPSSAVPSAHSEFIGRCELFPHDAIGPFSADSPDPRTLAIQVSGRARPLNPWGQVAISYR